MKQILIPTDFSVRSLHTVHDIVKRNDGKKVAIHIFHMVQIPTDITELIFFRRSYLYKKVPTVFTEAMQMLRNRYASHLKLELHFGYGNHIKALEMTIESLGIEEIYSSGKHVYILPFANSVDVICMFPKCSVPAYRIGSKQTPMVSEEANMLSSLFSDDAVFSGSNSQMMR